MMGIPPLELGLWKFSYDRVTFLNFKEEWALGAVLYLVI